LRGWLTLLRRKVGGGETVELKSRTAGPVCGFFGRGVAKLECVPGKAGRGIIVGATEIWFSRNLFKRTEARTAWG